ncbi:MAG: GAG-pre-integrase domain-containing protein [Candidatus Saccharimonadales bacterium]
MSSNDSGNTANVAAGESKGNELASTASAYHSVSNSFCIDGYTWITDTGATSHMTPHKHWLKNYTPLVIPIKLADNSVVYSEGVGNVEFTAVIGENKIKELEFSRVLYIPKFHTNLLSVLYLTEKKNFHVLTTKGHMFFSHKDQLIFSATVKDRVGYLNGTMKVQNAEFVGLTNTVPLDWTLWHRRMAHHHLDGIKKLMEEKLVTGLQLTSKMAPDPVQM